MSRPLRGAGCSREIAEVEGAVRLRGGFGTPCDPLRSGIVEVFHFGEWGTICGGNTTLTDDFFATGSPQVICRELGFAFGDAIDAPVTTANTTMDAAAPAPAPAPPGRIWLKDAVCEGVEASLQQCHSFPAEFLAADSPESVGGCGATERELAVACRQFPVSEAEMFTAAAMPAVVAV